MGQRLAVVMTWITAMMVPVLAAERQTSLTQSALAYFEGQGNLTIDEFLARFRPPPIDDRDRARIIAALPAHGAIRPGAHELAKMSLAQEVLAYHQRRGRITFTMIDVPPAFVGLHERAVILVSAHALSLVNNEQFAALVAHEIGHEYVWKEYELAIERGDQAHVRELELRCDGIAVLTLRRLGLGVDPLVKAVEMLTWYNQERHLDRDRRDYVSRQDRRALIGAVAKLSWADRESTRANPNAR